MLTIRRSKPLSELDRGETFEVQDTLSAAHVARFSVMFGLDDKVVPARAAGALLAHLITTRFPGPGSRIIAENLRYGGGMTEGDVLTTGLAVLDIDQQAGVARLACRVTGPGGMVLAEGEVEVLPPTTAEERALPQMTGLGPHAGKVMADLFARCRALPPVPTAVAHPCDAESLRGAILAAQQGLITPILTGPEARIRAIAAKESLDLSGIALIGTEHSHASAEAAVALVREGRAAALMKGSLHTDELLGAALAKEAGLRTERRVSHAFVLDAPLYPRPLIITDAAVNIAPDLEAKADIIRNAIKLAQAMGIATPKVAILAAVETVTPKMQATLDAAALCKMAERGQITGGVLDGPLAFDNAISPVAAAAKGIQSPVAGQADILLVPDLEAGNMLAKQLAYLGGAESAGIVLGLRVPMALTSRADNAMARLASAALLRLMAPA
ncbi:MAG: bifunctional enoyl-CoA hydratase/phosphate acetyltransferase [Alphaproteobacteria bacterium]|nr:bifunctional enoyl-CoA hydratase/phosphate acetyltransferase [Alphaproteobacteria bacterium]